MSVTDAAPIVTRRVGLANSWDLGTSLANDGYQGLRKALSVGPEAVATEVMAANLLGRGGAGFEAGKKWSMLRKADPVYLVVNGDESEPCTFKDHMLLEADPHQIVEGTAIAAFAVGATRAFIFVRGEFALGIERMTAAVNDAYRHGALGRDIFGSGYNLDIVIHPGAGAYICGEETALLESLEGKRGYPRDKPPWFPAVMGLYGAPTVVNNVETVSNLAWIVTNGGAAFAALGQGRSTGTRIFSLSGHVRRPGNYEVEMAKTTFADLIFDPRLGGGIRDGNDLKAFVPGGASAPWFGPDHLEMALDQDAVGRAGSMLGSGSVVVMDHTACMVKATWRITRFFHRESCGQCTPCREGGGWLDKILRRILEGGGRESDLDLLLDVCDNIAPGLGWPPQKTTICVLGPSIPSSITSAIKMFRSEFMAYIDAAQGSATNGSATNGSSTNGTATNGTVSSSGAINFSTANPAVGPAKGGEAR
ncbi:MAG: NADH-quinone oxidoreductase subunit NuoF [Acidimicrobiales bacterium]